MIHSTDSPLWQRIHPPRRPRPSTPTPVFETQRTHKQARVPANIGRQLDQNDSVSLGAIPASREVQPSSKKDRAAEFDKLRESRSQVSRPHAETKPDTSQETQRAENRVDPDRAEEVDSRPEAASPSDTPQADPDAQDHAASDESGATPDTDTATPMLDVATDEVAEQAALAQDEEGGDAKPADAPTEATIDPALTQQLAAQATVAAPQAGTSDVAADESSASPRSGAQESAGVVGQLAVDVEGESAAQTGGAQTGSAAMKLKAVEPQAPGATKSVDSPAAAPSAQPSEPAAAQSFQSTLDAASAPVQSAGPSSNRVEAPQATPSPEVRFAEDNADNIVQQVQTKLLPRGGQMQIRLDPPEPGALLVKVSVIDGRMTAMFTAENQSAADLLGNNLHQLKSSLEATGVQVDRMQVRTAESSSSNTSRDADSQSKQDSSSSAQSWQQHAERQRREQVQKMWDKLAGLEDLDLVA